MKTILSLLLLCVALNANGATYMLLSQTNTFANNITKNATNAANAYADSLTNGIVATATNSTKSYVDPLLAAKAPLASPALTGTPTINGSSVEGELTNKVAKAGDTMTGRLAFSGTTQPGIQLNNLTTTQRDALTGVNTNEGSILWNTTQKRINTHNGSAWTDGFVRYAGDTGVGALGITPSANTTGLTVSGFSQTASNNVALLDLSGTWNNGTGTNTALKVNVTDTASGSLSALADFQLSGTSRLKLVKNGSFNLYGSSASAGQGVYALIDGDSGGRAYLGIESGGSGVLSFGPGNAARDTILLRDAANVLAMRNGANGQSFRVYNTYTDTSNYERAIMAWSGNVLFVGAYAAGTGTARETVLNGNPLSLYSGNASRWQINTSGHFVAAADNTYDIGASGANRPRNVYVGTDITAGGQIAVGGAVYANSLRAASVQQIYWNSRSTMQSGADGNIMLGNNAANDFGRLQFGGTTASFPSLKRNGDNIDVRLADDSNYASLALRNLKGGSTKVLTSAAAADFLYVSVPNTNAIGGDVIWEVVATDGSETQSQTGRTRFDAVAKSTTVTAGLNTMTNNAVVTAGTLTVAIASNVTTNNVWALGATATTSLTTTNLLIKWRLETPSTFTINSL